MLNLLAALMEIANIFHRKAMERKQAEVPLTGNYRQVETPTAPRQIRTALPATPEKPPSYVTNRSFRDAGGTGENNHEAWSQKGNRLLMAKHYEEAVAAFDEALNLKPNAFYAWQQRGEALRRLHRYADALVSYNKAIEFSANPISRYQALNGKGALLFDLQLYEEAIGVYNQALALCPNGMGTPHIMEIKGMALSKLARYEEAAALFNEAYDKAVEVSAKSW